MKKILFISYDGMTDPLGQSQVIPYIIGLTKYGYQFTILSCDKPDRYRQHKEYVLQLLNGYPVEWVSIPYHKRPTVLSSIYDHWHLKMKSKKLHHKHRYDMVHTRPGVPTLVGLWLKKKYGIRFLNDVRGFWADERVDGGMWDLKKPVFKKIYHFFKRHEYECLEKADQVTCLTHAAKKEMQSWKNIAGQPLTMEVIPCSADLHLFNPAAISLSVKEHFKKFLQISDTDVIFSYLGSIGGWYLEEEMMRFCKVLSDKIPASRFLFISPHRHEKIIAAAQKSGLSEKKIITITAARHEVPVLLSFSRYSLFFIKPCYSKISSSPTKHGEIMAMGVPVITNSGVGDVKEIVEKYQAGFVIDDFSDSAFDILAGKIAASPAFDSSAIRQAAMEYYDLDKAVATYAKVYEKALSVQKQTV